MKFQITPTVFFIAAVLLAAIAFLLDKPSKALVVNGITFPKDFQTLVFAKLGGLSTLLI